MFIGLRTKIAFVYDAVYPWVEGQRRGYTRQPRDSLRSIRFTGMEYDGDINDRK